METIFMPKLLPRPQIKKTYREPLEAFVSDSIVIITGEKQGLRSRINKDLYKNCRIFTALTDRPGTKKQKDIFSQGVTLDHLWIKNECSRWNEALGIPEIFAIGTIEWYTRRDGTKDLCLKPIDSATHIECLFVGVLFMYGLHLIEETEKLKSKNIVTENYEYWDSQFEWLKRITINFKETVGRLKIDLGKTNMVKYIDTFLLKIEKQIKKARDHVKKILNKKGFTKQELIYI
jgi:hypothetical protein